VKLHRALGLLPLVALLALPALAEEGAGQAPAAPQPKMVLSEFSHDFGQVKPGTPLQYRFVVKNEGTADLRIDKVKAACGCTTVAYDTLIAAGKAGGITLSIKRTDTYKGEVEKSATVTTNDPGHASFHISLRATFPEK
jgi:hypothetical protein